MRKAGVRFARFCKAADYTCGLEGTALKNDGRPNIRDLEPSGAYWVGRWSGRRGGLYSGYRLRTII